MDPVCTRVHAVYHRNSQPAPAQHSMTEPAPATAGRTGTWTALSNPAFRNFWIFSFLAFIGASMQSVGAGWLMTQLDPSPLLVGMVQGSFTLSQFLMALPAGVVADLIDRRWVMAGALGCMMLAVMLLGAATLTGGVSPTVLIAMTFLFGLAAATMTPAMQATMPDLVTRELLPSALTLNGMTVSVARAVGPGLAGLMLGWWGAGNTFLLNGLAFVGLFVVVLRWRNRPASLTPAESGFGAALRAGLRFTMANPPVRRLVTKSAGSFFAVSILLALIPAIVERGLGGRPQTLGLLLGCFGLGSVLASFALGRLYQRLSRSRVIDLANVTHGIAVLCIASGNLALSVPAMFLAGLSWTAITTSVNIVAQLLLPAEFRARGLAINMMAMMGSLTLGAALWGELASLAGLQTAFLVAGTLGVLMPLLTSRLRLVEQLPGTSPAADAAP
jgi:MFS family permease